LSTTQVDVRRRELERSLAAGDATRALELSAALLESDSGNPDLLRLRAAALMAADRTDAAVDLLRDAANVAGAPGAIRSALAMCQFAAGEHAAAAETFREVLADRPEDFVARLAYAECLDLLGEADAALPEYFRAVNVAQAQGRWLSDASTGPAMRGRVKRAMDVIDHGRQALFERILQPHVDAFGREAMARVAEALRIHVGTQAAPQGDPRQQPKFFWMPSLPPTAFFPRSDFAWYDALEAAAPAIGEELRGVLDAGHELAPFLQIDDANVEEDYLGGDPQSRSWDALFFYRHGERRAQAHADCPRTSLALQGVPLTRIADHAPEVLFSVLAPQTHIKPHHGVTNTRVVTHLPLVIPPGDCALVVGGQSHAWQAGRCVTFDDTFLHEAWNRTDQRRVVLILDTWNPFLRAEECIALKDLVEGIGHFNQQAATG
jgi:aspartate beta-hydroxylase